MPCDKFGVSESYCTDSESDEGTSVASNATPNDAYNQDEDEPLPAPKDAGMSMNIKPVKIRPPKILKKKSTGGLKRQLSNASGANSCSRARLSIPRGRRSMQVHVKPGQNVLSDEFISQMKDQFKHCHSKGDPFFEHKKNGALDSVQENPKGDKGVKLPWFKFDRKKFEQT